MPLGDVYFSDDFQPEFGIPYKPVPPREVMAAWSREEVESYYALRTRLMANAQDNPTGAGWILPSWQVVQRNWKKYSTHVILGGNRCVRGDTPIYDPVLNTTRRIDSIKGHHHVFAWDGTKTVIAKAEQPFPKERGAMFRVKMTGGREFVASGEHLVLSNDGAWLSISQLRRGSRLFLPRTNLGTSLSGQMPDGPRSTETASGSPLGCPTSHRLYDGLPRCREETGQVYSPSPVDAPRHSVVAESICHLLFRLYGRLAVRTSDALGNRSSRSPVLSRFSRRAIPGALRRIAARCAGTGYRVSYKFCRLASGLSEGLRLPLGVPLFGRGWTPGLLLRESTQRGRLCGYEWPWHEEGLVLDIHSEGIDVKWDMTVPAYANYIADGVVHHNSSKSSLAARMCVWAAGTIPNAEVRAYHVNSDRSIEDQQRFIWEALPLGLKNISPKKGPNWSIQYSQKNGFTDDVCILPCLPGARRGGTIKFGNYRQYSQDAQIAEGFKSHVIWMDEECPEKFFETMQYRTIDYHGRLILTFTTLQGWTGLVQQILGKVRTLEKRYAPLLGKEVPVLQESLSRPGTLITYMWTADNAFIDTADFLEKIKGRPKDEVLARAYGIPTKSISGVFPAFSKEVNVIPHEKLPWLKIDPETGKPRIYPVTRYMAIDPAGSKNWFMLWVAIDAAGTWWVYREWPDYDDWALPGPTPEGKPGPASKGSRRGIKDYVELIRHVEGDEEVYERYIDPRLGAAEKQSQEGATTIISDLDDAGMTFIPAPGVEIENGLQLINNLLAFDDSKPIDSVNAPKLYVSDRCQNLIYALAEYTNYSRVEATKDPIDALRYLCVSNCEFFEKTKATMEPNTFSY